jgi:hypothetical protein
MTVTFMIAPYANRDPLPQPEWREQSNNLELFVKYPKAVLESDITDVRPLAGRVMSAGSRAACLADRQPSQFR